MEIVPDRVGLIVDLGPRGWWRGWDGQLSIKGSRKGWCSTSGSCAQSIIKVVAHDGLGLSPSLAPLILKLLLRRGEKLDEPLLRVCFGRLRTGDLLDLVELPGVGRRACELHFHISPGPPTGGGLERLPGPGA